MVEKLSVRIALEGGEEIERQLKDIGEAGQKAFANITESAEQVGGFKNIKPEEVTAKLKDMGVTGVDAIGKIQAAVQKAGKLEGLVQGIRTVEGALSALANAAPIAGAAIIAAMTAATKATIAFAESVNKINDTAIKLGVGVEQVDRFRAGLEQAGVSAESVGQILQSKLASEQGLQGLEAFIQALQRMPDSAARSKAAVEQFGAAGAELIRVLQAGGQLTGFGGTQGLINPQDAQKATQLTQAINQLESAYNRLNSLGFAPTLTVGINAATSAIEVLGERLQQTPWTTFFNAANLGLNPITSLISTINGALTFLGRTVQQTGQQVQQGVQIWTQWGTAATKGGQQATVAVQGGGTAAQTTGQQVQGGVQIWTQWGTAATQAGDAAAAAGQEAARAGQTAASGWDVFLRKLDEIARKAGTILGGGGGGGGGAPGMAGGGFIGGRGTGTSDSNLAWLSRGEYVMPAGAVRQPGVLSFLEALRRSGGIPGYAAGGEVGGGSGKKLWTFLDQVTDQLDRALRALNPGLVDAVVKVAAGVEQPMQSLLKFMNTIEGKARGGLLGGRGTGTSDSNLAWLSRGEYVVPARAVRQPGVLAFLEALRRSGRIPGFQEGGLSSGPNFPQSGWPFSGFGDDMKQAVQLGKANNEAIREVDRKVSQASADCAKHAKELEEFMDPWWSALMLAVDTTKDSMGRIEDRLAPGSINFPKTGWPFAAGGLMGGRGTGTSDSNLAWLSRGEHIMPARAVRQPGVLSFLEALRRSGGDLSRVLDGMGRFALGGMVPRAIPAFAAGGLAGGGNHVTIQFPGLPAIGGLRASSDVVDQLQKAAALAQVRSGGRKPSRYS